MIVIIFRYQKSKMSSLKVSSFRFAAPLIIWGRFLAIDFVLDLGVKYFEPPASEDAKVSSCITSIFWWKVLGFLNDSGMEIIVEATDGAGFLMSVKIWAFGGLSTNLGIFEDFFLDFKNQFERKMTITYSRNLYWRATESAYKLEVFYVAWE